MSLKWTCQWNVTKLVVVVVVVVVVKKGFI